MVRAMMLRLIALATVASLSIAPFPAANAAPLVGHRAAYSVTLDSRAADSGIVDVDGVVYYSFGDACDGWTVENSTRLRFQSSDGGQVTNEWAYATFEAKDGGLFRFQTRDRREDEEDENLRGVLRMTPDRGGKAVFDDPSGFEINVPPEAMLPTRHLMHLFEQAAAGKTHVTRTVFDGTTLDNPFVVSALIRPAAAVDGADVVAGAGLPARPVWHFRLAFFPAASNAPEPAFELAADFRDDGIAQRVKQDYGDFVLDLRLRRLETIPAPDCGSPSADRPSRP